MTSAPPPTDGRASDAVPPESTGNAPVGHPVLTREDVAHLAHLARLEVTEVELDLYVGQLSVILDSVAAVSEVAASEDIAPTTHAVPLTNVYRDDVVRPGLSQRNALAGAPAAEDGRFRVPQILGEEQ